MNNDVAIFVDLDNVVIGASEANVIFDINLVLEEINKRFGGRTSLRVAYGEWRQGTLISKQFASAGVELRATVRIGNMSKNLADMQMVVDALETLIDGQQFDTYVLVTGDRDFLPLVQALRKRGKKVVGMGVKHTSSLTLASLCDEYIFYEDIVQNASALEDEQAKQLLQTAVNKQLRHKDRVPASTLKQTMNYISEGGFSRSRQGHMSFRSFLEAYPDIVSLEHKNTVIYATKPKVDSDASHPDPKGNTKVEGAITANGAASKPSNKVDIKPLSKEEAKSLLHEISVEFFAKHEMCPSSMLKQKMQEKSDGAFSETKIGHRNFTQFLSSHPDLVTVKKDGTIVNVYPPSAKQNGDEQTAEPLHLSYRRELKKRGMRVIPAPTRLRILRDMITILQTRNSHWQQLVQWLSVHYGTNAEDTGSISKSQVNDVLRLAKRAKIINVDRGNGPMSKAAVSLNLKDGKVFQDAVMQCDALFLKELNSLKPQLQLDEAAKAIYDEPSRERYLKVVLKQFHGKQLPS